MKTFAGKMTFNQKGGWWVVGQFILLILILIIPGPVFPTTPNAQLVLHLIGGTSIVIASSVLLSGVISLRKGLSPFPYPIENSPFVQEGLYQFIRHPLYFGLILGGLGASLWRRNILAFGLSLVLALFLKAKADQEEIWLIQKFPEYRDYRKRTKQLIPFIY